MTIYKLIICIALGIVWNAEFSEQFFFKTKCLGKYGCFNNGPPFYDLILRPISLLPFDLKDFHTKFYLINSPTARVSLEPNAASLQRSGYDKNLGLRIFIHGFSMTFSDDVLAATQGFLAALKKADPRNTIMVDWSANNRSPYPQAVANGRVVGAQVAELIKFIMDSTGLDPRNVHIIGHSLGSHVAGWAGERIKNIGRITGLDPAGLYFQYSPSKVRLDTSDANFVDVIHTNAADIALQGLGIVQTIGHVDFYPNGGTNQPGCDAANVKITIAGVNVNFIGQGRGAFQAIMCNHIRAIQFFLESSSRTCKFIGYQCPDYDKFKWKRCQYNKKVEMGLFAKKENISPGSKFYLTTAKKEPFCISA